MSSKKKNRLEYQLNTIRSNEIIEVTNRDITTKTNPYQNLLS
jgi:hypothetical protein